MQTVTVLSLLGALGVASAQQTVLGVYIFSRHGGKHLICRAGRSQPNTHQTGPQKRLLRPA